MEERLGFDFGSVRIHDDVRAAESARAIGAAGYTVGRHVVLGTGSSGQAGIGREELLTHELTHVVQQGAGEPTLRPMPVVAPLAGGGHRVAVAPDVPAEPAGLEGEARTEGRAWSASRSGTTSPAAPVAGLAAPAVMRVRVPIPRPVPLCGRTLTHVDIEPPRARPLEPCLPPTVMVTRINIVGRDLTVPTPGRGPQVFNLHIGYYRDPATGRYCAIADDSRVCVCPRCVFLGCFPTLREVLEAIKRFLKTVLTILGIIALAIIIALIIEMLGPILVPAFAEAGSESAPDGGDEGVEPAAPAEAVA
jgi:hypothetical protein